MKKMILLAALFSLIFVMTSCQKGEEVTVTKYFQAMKHNDKDTMSAMATEPKDLEYKAYKITSVSEPVITELELPGLEKQLADFTKEKKEQVNIAMEKNYDVEDLEDEMEETRRRSKKAELKKKIEEAQVIADQERQKVLQLQLKINLLEKKISKEKNLITTSTGVSKSFELYTGETHFSKVVVNVTLTNEEVKDYVFLLRQDFLTMQDTARPPGRLVITKIATLEDYEKELKQQEEEKAMETEKTEEVSEEQPAADTGSAAEG